MKTTQFPGSRWWKFDFHTHTPASSDYADTDKHITPRNWLLAHMNKEIDAVVVTDHNSAEWVDQLKVELKTLEATRPEGWREMVLFPGVEITTSERVHLLAVFAPQTTTSEINGLLNGSNVDWDKPAANSGNAEWRMRNVNIIEMMQRIKGKGGLAIPAHVDRINGLLASQSSSPYQADTPRSAAICDALKEADAIDVRDPQDAVMAHFANQIGQLAQVDGSDSPHSLANIGRTWVWLKMGKPSLEGLKLALAEPQLSVRRANEQPDNLPKLWIESLEIKELNKRWQPLKVQFNPWLNTVIGGRGSGKSSIVECLRWALGRSGEADVVREAINGFDKNMLLPTTALKVVVSGAGALGGIYRYEWSRDQQYVMRRSTAGSDEWVGTDIKHTDVPTDFPVRLFSQKQIHALANKTGGLLVYLDSSRTQGQWQKIKQLELNFGADPRSAQLEAQQNRVGKGLQIIATSSSAVNRFEKARERVRTLQSELLQWPQIKDQLAQVKESLDTYAKQGVNDRVQTLQKLRAEKRTLNDFIEGVESEVEQLKMHYESRQLNDWEINLSVDASSEAKTLAESWQISFKAMQATWSTVNAQVQQLAAQTEQLKTQKAFLTWHSNVQAQERECLTALENVKSQLGGQLQQVGILQQQKEDLERQHAQFEARQQELGTAKEQVDLRYKEMLAARVAITQARQDFVNQINTNAPEETLQITIHCAAQYNEESLKKFKEIFGLNTAEYANTFLGNPEDGQSKGVVAILAKEPDRLDEFKRAIEELVGSNGKHPQKILETDLGSDRSYLRNTLKGISNAKLDALWTWFPEDKVEVKFRQSEKGEWQDISEGSAGQKTGALLSFILNEGDEPLILDQPEDDLDNENVSKLVVEQLRKSKSRRQIIVVTHNANIVVNGDAELVIPMAFRKGQIQMDSVGGLQDIAIRKKVCEVMEGGEKAFRNRYKRVLEDLPNKA